MHMLSDFRIQKLRAQYHLSDLLGWFLGMMVIGLRINNMVKVV